MHTAEKHVVSCELSLGSDDVWEAVVSEVERSTRGHVPAFVGRSSRQEDAIARAMNRGRMVYASAVDEQAIAVAAFRRRQVRLMMHNQEIHFLSMV